MSSPKSHCCSRSWSPTASATAAPTSGPLFTCGSKAARPRSAWRSPTLTARRAPSGRGGPTWSGGGGLGLHIVERLASRWGVRDDPRTAVWFELDCDPETLL